MIDVGIVGVGTYLPEKTMKAAEIAGLTNGVWSEDAVINKLGIKQRYLPGPDDGTQEMGAKAALKCLEKHRRRPQRNRRYSVYRRGVEGISSHHVRLLYSGQNRRDKRVGYRRAESLLHLRVRDENRRGYVESRRRNKYHYDLRRLPQRRLRGFYG